MKNKYYVTGRTTVELSGKWLIKTTSFVIEAKDRTEAEQKTREKGYVPLSVQRLK